MVSDAVQDAARVVLCHALIVSCWCLLLGHVGIGSGVTLVMLGAVASAVVAGLWLGAVAARCLRGWTSCSASMPSMPWPTLLRDAMRPAAHVGALWALSLVAVTVSSLWSGETPARVALAHAVLIGPMFAALGLGVWIEWAVRATRLTVAYGAVAWIVPTTAFLWAPGIVEPGRAVLERAVRVNPASAVLAALGRQNIFWTPALYGTLPYADYGVRLGSPSAQAAAWACVGVGLVAARVALAHVTWRRG